MAAVVMIVFRGGESKQDDWGLSEQKISRLWGQNTTCMDLNQSQVTITVVMQVEHQPQSFLSPLFLSTSFSYLQQAIITCEKAILPTTTLQYGIPKLNCAGLSPSLPFPVPGLLKGTSFDDDGGDNAPRNFKSGLTFKLNALSGASEGGMVGSKGRYVVVQCFPLNVTSDNVTLCLMLPF